MERKFRVIQNPQLQLDGEEKPIEVGDKITEEQAIKVEEYHINHYGDFQFTAFFQEISPAEEILKKLINVLEYDEKSCIEFSKNSDKSLDFDEIGIAIYGYEEDDFDIFESWKPTEEEKEYLMELNRRK